MDITIKASDGRQFNGTDYEKLVKEVNKYEAELKQKELEMQERLKKLEEERKVKVDAREKAMKSVNDAVELVNQAVEKYEKETGEKLEYVTLNGKLTTQKANTDINIPFVQWTNPNGTSVKPWWYDFYTLI